MDDFIWSIYYFSWHCRMASVIIFICIGIFIPQRSWCFTENNQLLIEDILFKVDLGKTEEVLEKFNVLGEFIDETENSIEKCREFLDSFISQMNSHYGLFLTLEEAFKIVRNNFPLLRLSSKEESAMVAVIDFIEKSYITIAISDEKPEVKNIFNQKLIQSFDHVYWPWEWNWFGWRKKSYSVNKNLKCSIQQDTEIELPGNCYFGACEAFAGALICIIPHPLTWSAGIGMIADGGRRVIEGVIQLSEERRLNPNYKSPTPPF